MLQLRQCESYFQRRSDTVRRNMNAGIAIACIVALFLITVVRLHPANFFGYTEDDSIYFSSAKALSLGRGYILDSVPGRPAATKYPILYPWILSWVWRSNPSFPANINDAIAINALFGSRSFWLLLCFSGS